MNASLPMLTTPLGMVSVLSERQSMKACNGMLVRELEACQGAAHGKPPGLY